MQSCVCIDNQLCRGVLDEPITLRARFHSDPIWFAGDVDEPERFRARFHSDPFCDGFWSAGDVVEPEIDPQFETDDEMDSEDRWTAPSTFQPLTLSEPSEMSDVSNRLLDFESSSVTSSTSTLTSTPRTYAPSTPANAEIREGLDDDVTLMVRNIPNKYSQALMLEHLAEWLRDVDFFYLPMDFRNKHNLGYVFLNFKDGAAADHFFHTFHGERLPAFENSKKRLNVQRSLVQGVAANVEKFRSSAVMRKPEVFRPLLLEQGRPVPFPAPTQNLPAIGARYARTSQ